MTENSTSGSTCTENAPICFGRTVRTCNLNGAKKERTHCTGVPRNEPQLLMSAFDTGCGTSLFHLDGTANDQQECLAQKIDFDYTVLATHPRTGVLYGVGAAPQPSNNTTCANAQVIDVFTNGLVSGNTCRGAINNPPMCGNQPLNQAPGLWYTLPVFEQDVNIAFATISPCTNFNTFIMPYSGPCDALQCLDGFTFNPVGDIRLSFTAFAGQEYYIYVTGLDQIAPPADAGSFEMWVTADDNFYFPSDDGLTTTVTPVTPGQNFDLPPAVGRQCGGATLFRYDPCLGKPIQIGRGFDNIVSVFDIAFPNNAESPDLFVLASNQANIVEQFLISEEDEPSYSLHRVNIQTGQSEKIGDVFPERQTRVGNGLAFDCDDRLWLVSKIADPGEVPEDPSELALPTATQNENLNERSVRSARSTNSNANGATNNEEGEGEPEVPLQPQLFELDPETGAVLSVCDIQFIDFPRNFLPFTNLNPRLNALAFNKCQNTMYVLVRDIVELFAFGFNAANANTYLATLDTQKAQVTLVKQLETAFGQGLTTELLI